MALTLSDDMLSSVRFARIHEHMNGYLLQLDRERFRGLGASNCRAFVQQGVAYCDAIDVTYLEHIEYVHFIMYFLGTRFHRDPRYRMLADKLAEPDLVSTERIANAHRVFSRLGERFIGKGLQKTRQAMARFNASLDGASREDMPPDVVFDAFYDAHAFDDREQQEMPEAELLTAAQDAARTLGIDVPAGQSVCLALALWLGAGFAEDPLFPWVRDVSNRAGEEPVERALALERYALKRMKKMVDEG